MTPTFRKNAIRYLADLMLSIDRSSPSCTDDLHYRASALARIRDADPRLLPVARRYAEWRRRKFVDQFNAQLKH